MDLIDEKNETEILTIVRIGCLQETKREMSFVLGKTANPSLGYL